MSVKNIDRHDLTILLLTIYTLLCRSDGRNKGKVKKIRNSKKNIFSIV